MWIYDRQDSETETLTHLKTGVQVRRSASENMSKQDHV